MRAKLRIVLALYLATIYSTLYVVRFVTNYLRDHHWLRPTVVVCFAVAAAGMVWLVFRDRRNRSVAVVLTLIGAAIVYACVIYPMDSPEEKIHFIEYGVVGLLADAASPASWSPRKRFLLCELFVVAAGWTDEGIQGLLPNRYYDLRDVAFNAAAGVMALTVLAVLRLVTRIRRETPAPAG